MQVFRACCFAYLCVRGDARSVLLLVLLLLQVPTLLRFNVPKSSYSLASLIANSSIASMDPVVKRCTSNPALVTTTESFMACPAAVSSKNFYAARLKDYESQSSSSSAISTAGVFHLPHNG